MRLRQWGCTKGPLNAGRSITEKMAYRHLHGPRNYHRHLHGQSRHGLRPHGEAWPSPRAIRCALHAALSVGTRRSKGMKAALRACVCMATERSDEHTRGSMHMHTQLAQRVYRVSCKGPGLRAGRAQWFISGWRCLRTIHSSTGGCQRESVRTVQSGNSVLRIGLVLELHERCRSG